MTSSSRSWRNLNWSTHYAQLFEPAAGEVLLRVVGTDEACSFDISVGQGRAIVISAAYTCDIPLFRKDEG